MADQYLWLGGNAAFSDQNQWKPGVAASRHSISNIPSTSTAASAGSAGTPMVVRA